MWVGAVCDSGLLHAVELGFKPYHSQWIDQVIQLVQGPCTVGKFWRVNNLFAISVLTAFTLR